MPANKKKRKKDKTTVKLVEKRQEKVNILIISFNYAKSQLKLFFSFFLNKYSVSCGCHISTYSALRQRKKTKTNPLICNWSSLLFMRILSLSCKSLFFKVLECRDSVPTDGLREPLRKLYLWSIALNSLSEIYCIGSAKYLFFWKMFKKNYWIFSQISFFIWKYNPSG